MSAQRDVVGCQQGREVLTREKSVFMLAMDCQRVEADKGFVDKSGMTHDETTLRQPVEKFSHQGAEIGLPGKIIGAGESGIEGDIGAPGAAAELRAQDVEEQRLG